MTSLATRFEMTPAAAPAAGAFVCAQIKTMMIAISTFHPEAGRTHST